MAYVTPIGANPTQVEYRLSKAHCCGDEGGTSRRFSSHSSGTEYPLRWIGEGLVEFGINAGSVLDESQFGMARSLMEGRDPRTGEVLVEAKRVVHDDAKVALGPLVRTVEAVAAEADVSISEVLGGESTNIERFERARRAVQAQGEAARLRADHACKIADAAGVPVSEVWGTETYKQAADNLFETVVEDQEDGTTKPVRRPRRARAGNAGYDVTLTLPKSYSMVMAFASPEDAAALEALYYEQAKRTFAWLEGTTAYGMRGWHGDGHTADTVPGSGYLGWTMVHRAARPTGQAEVGDPHWHVHITIANMTKGTDERWSTVAAGGRDLMRHVPAADQVFKALTRYTLHQQFGVRFERNSRTGAWEIIGIPDETLQQFSKRDSDIATMLQQMGYDADTVTRSQKHIAEQRSRKPKEDVIESPDATLQELWQSEERGTGRDPQLQLRKAFRHRPGGNKQPTAGSNPPANTKQGQQSVTPSVADIAAQLLDPDLGLTAHSRRFTRADALARVADTLPRGCRSIAELDALTDAVLAKIGFLRLSGPGAVEGPNGVRKQLAAGHMANATLYTTQDVVDSETVILRAAKASHADQLDTRVSEDVFTLGTNIVEATQPYPLDTEQRSALHRVVTNGYGIDTVTGRPGSGKTTLMRTVRAVYEAAGYVIHGAATAAVAAQNLETESGIPTRTIASLLDAIVNGKDPLRGVDVLAIDEANLTDDRDRAQLYLQAATHGTKIVEVGDGKQLRGVGMGSLFGRIHEIVDGAELRNNRRQAEEDERAAVEAWRDGRYVEAFSIWQGNGRFHATETQTDTTAAMVAHWWRQRQGTPDAHTEMRGLAMLAATNAQVRRLNDAAQAVRLAEGELGDGRTYEVAGAGQVRLYVGDHVMLRVNDRAGEHTQDPPVLNGYRAIIRAIDEDGTVHTEWQHETTDGLRKKTAALSPRYVAIGGLDLGYAMTIHKAEGLTVGGTDGQWLRPDGQYHAGRVLFHAPGADNPAAYVALSRHKQQVDIFGSLEELETEQQRYLLGQPRTRAETHDRAIDRLAEHARHTETHGDRPVVADLGIPEFLSETAPDRQAEAVRQAAHAEEARLREERQAKHEVRARRRAERERERADREAHQRQRRMWAADVLREVWRHEPSLAEKVIAAAAFDRVARNLADAYEAGYDVRAVLAEAPTSTIASPRIHDKPRFTAWSIDHAVERIRTGEAARDHERAAEWEQTRDQAADLVTEVWSSRPELAEAVVDSSAFDRFVRNLDDYTTAGLDPRGLLTQISLDKLADPTIRDTGAFATYSLRRIGDRQLDEIEDVQQRAKQRAQAEQQQHEVAETLRQAWNHTPEAAERVITDRSFPLVAEQMAATVRDGHDINALLERLSPDMLAGTHVDNPSGKVAFALKRTIAEAEHETAAASVLESKQPDLALDEPDLNDELDLVNEPFPEWEPGADEIAPAELEPDEEPTPADPEWSTPPLPEPEPESDSEFEPQIEHWHDRTYGQLTETQLDQQAQLAQQQAQRSATQRETAEQHATELRTSVEAGQGPETTAVDDHLAELRQQAAVAREADEVETNWQTTVDRAGQAAENRVLAERERDQLGWFARSRHTELDTRITELAETEDTAHREAADLAERAAPLQQQTGDRDQRRRTLSRARAAESDYDHARQTAQGRDESALASADRRTARLSQQQAEYDQQAHELTAEQQLRVQMPEYLAEHEAAERAAEVSPAEASVEPGQLNVSVDDPHVSLELEADVSMGAPQAEIAEPDEPEL